VKVTLNELALPFLRLLKPGLLTEGVKGGLNEPVSAFPVSTPKPRFLILIVNVLCQRIETRPKLTEAGTISLGGTPVPLSVSGTSPLRTWSVLEEKPGDVGANITFNGTKRSP
jgi:hypothetical protein